MVSTPVAPSKRDPVIDLLFTGMWDDVFADSSVRMPADWYERMDRAMREAPSVRLKTERSLIVRGPIGWTVEQAEAELTILALVLLRWVPALQMVTEGRYEWQLDDTEAIATSCADWLLSLPAEELSVVQDWRDTVETLTVLGVMPPWLRAHFWQVIGYGIDYITERPERRKETA